MHILHIDSSIQGEQSVSRRLSAAVVRRLRDLRPDARIVYRDLAAAPLPHLSPAMIEAAHGSEPDATALSSALDEVLAADVIVVGTPMYNFGVPSQLKSWLDALAAPGRTFRYGPQGPEGLLGDKRVIVASARGGFYGPGAPGAGNDHQESYLRAFFGFLGVTDIEVVRAEGVRIAPDVAERAVAAALEQVARLQAA
ncbi:FMN-dependent NADH-azoreductase [Coralloluteibacterium thermophilus]|uniref:FMN dependent NADH:quinone oxidoreductase n=1 Tax=Coralloluteibacterium thermophilum TaxID=2707049 RepID=A0ABV9NJ87_9GAMM